jgi:hypothetical protein
MERRKIAKRESGMSAARGSCLCGGVKFEITGPLSSPLNCHCSICRKQHGAAFRSRVRILQSGFRWHEESTLLALWLQRS